MLTDPQYRLLLRIAPRLRNELSGSAYQNKSKIRVLLGDSLVARLSGAVVIDFGCGDGEDTLEIARSGAKKVIGIDIRESALQVAREAALRAGLDQLCEFCQTTKEKADAIVSLDGFEHFSDPAGALRAMHDLLKPGGFVAASFDPTWYHPYGGHLFSVFPWAHLIFSEDALIRWRSHFRSDGATRFGGSRGRP
jgi:SAM-dependent methyltransferase